MTYIPENEHQRGPTRQPQGWGARPTRLGAPPALPSTWLAPGAHLLLYEVFTWKKSEGSFRDEAPPSQGGTWRNQSRAPAELFYRESITPGGGIITIVITIDPLIRRGSISINIFTSTISFQTLVHLLYPIFVSKPQIGTCGLLVVLITPYS